MGYFSPKLPNSARKIKKIKKFADDGNNFQKV